MIKTVCMKNGTIQVRRVDTLREYEPTHASRKRFITMSLKNNLVAGYKTFKVLTAAGFRERATGADIERMRVRLWGEGARDQYRMIAPREDDEILDLTQIN